MQVDKIIDHGINCFVNRQLIYNFPEEIFADAGVMAIEHADFDGIERLALVTGNYKFLQNVWPYIHIKYDCIVFYFISWYV